MSITPPLSPAAIAVNRARARLIDRPDEPALLGEFANTVLRRGQATDAVISAKRSLHVNPAITPWIRRLIELLMENQRWDLAIALFKAIVASTSASPAYSADLANALWNSRTGDEIDRKARQASVLQPMAISWILALAEHHLAHHQDDLAEPLVRRALLLDGGNTDAWKRRAGLAARAGTRSVEARYLRAGLVTDPTDRVLLERYIRVLGQLGLWREANIGLRNYAAAAPEPYFQAGDQVWRHETIGHARLRESRFAAAITPFKRAVILRPDQPAHARALSRALLEVGRGVAAMTPFAWSLYSANRGGVPVAPKPHRLWIEHPSDHARRHNLPYERVGDAFRVDLVGPSVGRRTISYEVPARFLLALDKPRVIDGTFWAVTESGTVLLEGLSYHQRRREDFGPFFKYVTDAGEVLAALPEIGGRLPGAAALLGGGQNYYHCVMDWFSRLPQLTHRANLADIPLIVSPRMPPTAHEWLDLLGVDRARLITAPASLFEVEKLWIPSLGHGRYGEVSPLHLDFLENEALAPVRDRRQPGRRRLFLSRHLTSHRHLANSEQIRPVLDRLGFEIVTPESEPLVEQLALFADAAIIVGTFGAGLTNIIAAPAGTPIIELTHPGAARTMFSILAGLLELPFHRLIGHAIPSSDRLPLHHDFRIDPEELEQVLRRVLDAEVLGQ